MTVKEEAASLVAETHPQEARQEAITQEAHQEEAHQEEAFQEEAHQEEAHQAAAHQEAVQLEEELPIHFREDDAHRMISRTSSCWRNLVRMAEA